MDKNLRERWYVQALVAFALTAAYVGIVKAQIPFMYAINDDVNMRNMVSGMYTGKPDAHVVFMLYPLAWLIKGFYTFLPGFDWYGLFLIGLQALSLYFVLLRVLTRGETLSGRILGAFFAVSLFSILWLPHFMRAQFTTVAASLGAGALFWYGLGEDKRVPRLVNQGVTVLLALLTFCVRFEVFFITAAFACALFFYREQPLRKKSLRAYSLPIAIGLGALILYGWDFAAYSSPDWRSYLKYATQSRSDIYDFYEFPAYDENQMFYENMGIDENGYKALLDSNMAVIDGIDYEAFDQIRNQAKATYDASHSLGEKLSIGLQLIGENLAAEGYGLLSRAGYFLWAILFAFALYRREKKELGYYGVFLAIQAGLWLYLGYGGRLPERVGLTMHLISFTVAFILFLDKIKTFPENRGIADSLALAFLALVLGAGAYQDVKAQAENSRPANEMSQKLKEYCLARPDQFFFVDVYSLSALTGTINARSESPYLNYMRLGDWPAFSPLYEEKLERQKITDIKKALVEHENLFLITRDDNSLEYLKNMLKGSYPDFTFTIVDVIAHEDFYLYVYQYRRGGPGHMLLEPAAIVQAVAHENGQDAYLALDQDDYTRWTSGVAQSPGMAYDLTLDQVHTLTGLRLDLRYYEDRPRKLRIFASVDNQNWTEIPADTHTQIEYTFAPTQARYLRLLLGGEDPVDWNWSIYEITLFEER